MERTATFVLLVCSGLSIYACSSESTPSDAGGGGGEDVQAQHDAQAQPDVSTVVDSSTKPDVVTPADTGTNPNPVNGCTSFNDQSSNGGTVNGPMTPTPAQFSPNCVRIKAGQSVTFNVDFAAHPLAASGGDTGNPITTTVAGTSVTFQFTKAGTYGFHCLAHPTIMFGAIQVMP
jgi:plastocyanin